MNLKAYDLKHKTNIMTTTPTSYNTESDKTNLFPYITLEEKIKCGVIPKEDEVTSSEETIVVTETRTTTSEKTKLFFESTKKILITAIKWAKSIPSFQQLLIEGINKIKNNLI